MRVIYLINILVIICLFGCKSPTNKKEIQQLLEIRNNQPELKPVINILHQVQRGDTLEIVSDGELTWNPFVVGLVVDSLQSRYGNSFNLKRNGRFARIEKGNSFIEILENESEKNAEYLAEHHHSAPPAYMLSEAVIFDDAIQLQHGIKIGMSKNHFFNLMGFQGDVSSINVVQNFDPPGDFIEQTFVFNGGKLSCISMRSSY